jgi:hypothetical protein
MKSSDLLSYMNRKRTADMQRLARDVQVEALEMEIRGIDVELSSLRGSHAKLVSDIGERETERSSLQIQLNDLRGVC